MNIIGQLTYNLTINGNKYSNITEAQITSDAFSVASPSKAPLIKLGIQAPLGTIAMINGQEIMIGRTEMYEMLSGIEVTSLYFPKSKNPNLSNIIIDYAYVGG